MSREIAHPYRHEMKYFCSIAQMALIQNRMKGVLKLDKHVGKEGMYSIRSLYFDDYYDTYYYDNEKGADPREKFRIRIYNHSSEQIQLELKKKVLGKTQKFSCPLTLEQCQKLMRGEVLPFDRNDAPILQKLCLLMKTRLMRPKVIVEYDRVPYVYANGNVRITLDQNISSSQHIDSFLEENIIKRPIMLAGQHLLEVKYDEYLPDFIDRHLQIENLRQTAFSKYYLCRKYTV